MRVLTDPLGWFTLEFPERWESATDDCVTTLRNPDGVGVVYISGARRTGGPQEGFGGAAFLTRFLRTLGLDVGERQLGLAQGPGCRIYSYTRDGDGRHWRYFSITDGETALLVTYACQLDDVKTEDAEVDAIVRSVRLYHSVPA